MKIVDPYIDPRKIVDYLLNLNHPDGGSKAVQLIAAGFRRDRPQELTAEILRLVATHDCIPDPDSIMGDEYLVLGPLFGPGRIIHVKTVWYSPPRRSQPAEAQLHKFAFGTMYKQDKNLQ